MGRKATPGQASAGRKNLHKGPVIRVGIRGTTKQKKVKHW